MRCTIFIIQFYSAAILPHPFQVHSSPLQFGPVYITAEWNWMMNYTSRNQRSYDCKCLGYFRFRAKWGMYIGFTMMCVIPRNCGIGRYHAFLDIHCLPIRTYNTFVIQKTVFAWRVIFFYNFTWFVSFREYDLVDTLTLTIGWKRYNKMCRIFASDYYFIIKRNT